MDQHHRRPTDADGDSPGRIAQSEGTLRNETFGAGQIVLREEPEAIVVPNEAVHWEGCCHVVFVRDKDYFDSPESPKVFHVRTVRLGAKNEEFTEIIAGVLPGEVVATKGSDVLRAELLEEQPGRRLHLRQVRRLRPSMLNWIIDFSLRHRALVILAVVAFAVVGVVSLRHLDIDAFPDTTPVQVQINTVAPALGAGRSRAADHLPGRAGDQRAAGAGEGAVDLEVRPVAGRRHVRGRHRHLLRPAARSTSGSARSSCPTGIERPQDGAGRDRAGRGLPLRRDRRGRRRLEAARDETHREADRAADDPRLGRQAASCGRCAGVAEVNSWGGYEKQYQVRIDPDRLIKHGLTFDEVVEAVEENNRNVGGGSITQGSADAARPRRRPDGQRRADREHRRHGQGRRADPRRRRGRRARSATRSAAGRSRPTAGAKSCSAWASC